MKTDENSFNAADLKGSRTPPSTMASAKSTPNADQNHFFLVYLSERVKLLIYFLSNSSIAFAWRLPFEQSFRVPELSFSRPEKVSWRW